MIMNWMVMLRMTNKTITTLPAIALPGTTITIKPSSGEIDLNQIKQPEEVFIEFSPENIPAKWKLAELDDKRAVFKIIPKCDDHLWMSGKYIVKHCRKCGEIAND